MSDKQTTEQTEKPKRKAPRTAFKPGVSGNPKGRPPSGQSQAEVTREFLDQVNPETGITYGEQIRQVKLKLALAGNLQAIESLEVRAYGKPVDTLKLEGAATPPQGFLGIMSALGIAEQGDVVEGEVDDIIHPTLAPAMPLGLPIPRGTDSPSEGEP